MRITAEERRYLRSYTPFEAMVWYADETGIPDCAFHIPNLMKPQSYRIVFTHWKVLPAGDKVMLYYRVDSTFLSYARDNLHHVFSFKDKKQQKILTCLLKATHIKLHALYSNQTYPQHHGTCEWSQHLRSNLLSVLEDYAKRKVRLPDWLDFLNPSSSQEKITLEEVKVIPHDNKAQAKPAVTTRAATIVTRPASSQPEAASAKSPEQEVVLPSTMPLIERCIYYLRNGKPDDNSSWNALLIAGLEQARLFTWEREALDLLESKRQALKEIEQPVLSSNFPSSLLWFEIAAPIKTPVCPDVAAIFLFLATAKVVYKTASLKALPQEEVARLRTEAYKFERNRLSILVVNSQGKLVWSMSLPTTVEEARIFQSRPWLVPQWFRCPQHKCGQFVDPKKLGGRMLYWNLCPACKEGQIFFSTWILAARQALLGQYRNKSIDASSLDNIGTRRVEHVVDANAYAHLRAGRVRQYTQIVTYKDISKSLTSWKPEIKHRGSWVEALKAIDPSLVTEKVQYVAEHKRRLDSEYFTNMRGQEINIESFSRNSPVRADLMDVSRKTNVVAKNGKETTKKRRK